MGASVRIYNGKQLVSTLMFPDVSAGLVFGRYGREDNSLLSVQRSGGLYVRMLPRSAKLEVSGAPRHPLHTV
jgi:Bardet-Biedl syndrome 1 protein